VDSPQTFINVSDSETGDLGLYIGIGVGAFVLLLLIVIVALVVAQRRRKARGGEQEKAQTRPSQYGSVSQVAPASASVEYTSASTAFGETEYASARAFGDEPGADPNYQKGAFEL
jgi:hypothetical protein